jgi:hypothetical protein
MNWKEFKARGGSATFLVILAGIIAAVLISLFFGKEYAELSVLRKVLSALSFLGSILLGYIGDRAKVFTPEKESDWRGGYGRWVLGIAVLFILAVLFATA